MRFQVFYSTADHKFYFRLRAANGQIILTSDGYATKGECKAAVAEVVENVGDEARLERHVSRDGRYFFLIKNPAGEEVASSQFYASASSLSRAMDLIKDAAPTAEVVDRARTPLQTPPPEAFLDLDNTNIPADVLDRYVRSVNELLEHVAFRVDAPAGRAFAQYADLVRGGAEGGAPADEGFDCAGSVGTFGTWACAGTAGGTAGTAGSVGTAGSFGCADPDDISLCWGNGEEDEDEDESG